MMTENRVLERNKLHFVFLLLLSYCVGFFIMAFLQTPSQMEWYQTLKVSSLTPPDITFSIVWTILYFLIALSAWLVWDKISHSLFYMQFVGQVIWSFTFFVMHWLWGGFFVLVGLCLIVLWLLVLFYKKSLWADILWAPYAVWCIFAAFLNLMTAVLN